MEQTQQNGKCSENEHSILNIVEKELVNDGKENLEIHLLSHKAAESVSTISLSASAVSYENSEVNFL